MASSVIHLAVASEINKELKRDRKKLLLGSVAPDLSKLVGENKVRSHFLTNREDIPNIDLFLEKYKNNLDNDFVMGYFIHLYTDYLWFKYFTSELLDKNLITKLDGTVVRCQGNMLIKYIYNDYTNLNIRLINEYNIDLDDIFKDIGQIDFIIDEIKTDKINLLIDKVVDIYNDSRTRKDLVFDIENIKKFIELSCELILAKIKEI